MNIVYAKTTAQVQVGSVPHMVRLGTHWRDDDPVVLACPSIFDSDPRHGLARSIPMQDESEVEQATAAPGERRNVRRGE